MPLPVDQQVESSVVCDPENVEAQLAGLSFEQGSKLLDALFGFPSEAGISHNEDVACEAAGHALDLAAAGLSSRTALDYFNHKVRGLSPATQRYHRRQLLSQLLDDGRVRYEWWVYSSASRNGAHEAFLLDRHVNSVLAADEGEALSMLVGCLPDDLTVSKRLTQLVPLNRSVGSSVRCWNDDPLDIAEETHPAGRDDDFHLKRWKVHHNPAARAIAESLNEEVRNLDSTLNDATSELNIAFYRTEDEHTEDNARRLEELEDARHRMVVALDFVKMALGKKIHYFDHSPNSWRWNVRLLRMPDRLREAYDVINEQSHVLRKDVDPSELRDTVGGVLDTVYEFVLPSLRSP